MIWRIQTFFFSVFPMIWEDLITLVLGAQATFASPVRKPSLAGLSELDWLYFDDSKKFPYQYKPDVHKQIKPEKSDHAQQKSPSSFTSSAWQPFVTDHLGMRASEHSVPLDSSPRHNVSACC